MSYIEPKTVITLYYGMPLDSEYENTFIFENLEEQDVFFTNYRPRIVYAPTTYQRTERGSMKIRANPESLFGVNYMSFTNKNFIGSSETETSVPVGKILPKTFYCFVTKIGYINNEVSEIFYEVDVMQTWMFDYELGECYVEREHSASDLYFENLVEENLELGDEYTNNRTANDGTHDHYIFDMNESTMCILANKENHASGSGVHVTGKIINNVYMPVEILTIPLAYGVQALDGPLLSRLENEIITIYQYPRIFGEIHNLDNDGNWELINGQQTYQYNVPFNLNSLDGYTPVNRKLFSYPYNYLLCSNNCGETNIYKWEDWHHPSPTNYNATFDIQGIIISTPTVLCHPTDYKYIEKAYDYGILYTNFPSCAWSGDTFKNWWVQNKGSLATTSITSIIGALGLSNYRLNSIIDKGDSKFTTDYLYSAKNRGISGVNVGSTVRGAINIANAIAPFSTPIMLAQGAANVASGIGAVRDISARPDTTHGQIQTDCLNPALGKQRFDFYAMSIKYQYAERIDKYFSRYGYATKKMKIPNRDVREQWCYTKTLNCYIRRTAQQIDDGVRINAVIMPQDDMQKIRDIYNNGVTFWRNPNNVGNFSLSNRPISEVT